MILDTNSLMLAAQAEAAGCEAWRSEILPDDPETIGAAVRDAATRADLVVIGAGSSAGRDDYTASIVARLGTLAVHGVAVRPGHPVVLGVVDGTPVLGAPGYPVSAALTFDIFAAPLLSSLEGAAPAEQPRARARVARKLASPMGMDDWVRVRLGRVGDDLVATPLPRGAGVLTSLVRADGLLVVPAGLEGHHAGETVDIALLRGVAEIDRTILAVGSHDLVLDLAASEIRAADPRRDAGVVERRVARRPRRVARRAVPRRRLAPARPGQRRVHAARTSTACWRGTTSRSCGWCTATRGSSSPRTTRLAIAGIDDLARSGVRYVNRQRGAGTRVLLDHELGRLGHRARRVSGYTREEHTHLAVAAAIAAGRVDAGLGVMAAARAFGLGFVPVTREPYDLVLLAETLEEPVMAPALGAARAAGVPGRRRGARRLRRRGHGSPDPLRIGSLGWLRDRRLTRRPQRMYP